MQEKSSTKGFAPILVIIIIALGLVTVATQNFMASREPVLVPTPSPTPTSTSTPILTPTPTPALKPTPKPTTNATPIPTQTPPPAISSSNAPPGSGYSRQSVQIDIGTYTVSIIAADLNSTKVIIDTASDSSCASDCPVLSLADYAGRNGAWAGVNGSYFCPRDYASCSGKENTFDTLLMNKNKTYFNSDNNVYSTVPAAIFYTGGARFVGQSLEWGRDTSVDAVIANHPLLVAGGQVVFGGSDDPKQGSKGNRSFVAVKGSIVYIGVVHSGTVAESARVLQALGMDSALNLDDGGSTALWHGGYKVGPGRALPNALLFITPSPKPRTHTRG